MDSTARQDMEATASQARRREGDGVAAARSGGLPAGTMFGERYLVVETLGSGGFGTVYRARDLQLARDVALKVLDRGRSQTSSDDEFAEALEVEARLTARLEHPNIARVHDAGRIERRFFLTMELVSGRSLADLLASGGPLPFDRALKIIRQACAALDHAHANGVVHRDVKPANILVGPDDEVHLVDFGIARLVRDLQAQPTEEVVGTVSYVAPEIWSGASPGPRSDLFAAAATFYAAVVGRPAFVATSVPELIACVTGSEPLPPTKLRSGLPRGLDGVLRTALAKDPALRFGSGRELVSALDRLDPRRRMKRRAVAATIAICAIIAAIAGARWTARPLEVTATLAARSPGPEAGTTRVGPASPAALASGDQFWIDDLRLNRDGHVVVMLLESSGAVSVLPLREPDRWPLPIRGGEVMRVPPRDAWQLDEHPGRETLFVAASRAGMDPAELLAIADRAREILVMANAAPDSTRGVKGFAMTTAARAERELHVDELLRGRFDTVETFVINHR